MLCYVRYIRTMQKYIECVLAYAENHKRHSQSRNHLISVHNVYLTSKLNKIKELKKLVTSLTSKLNLVRSEMLQLKDQQTGNQPNLTLREAQSSFTPKTQSPLTQSPQTSNPDIHTTITTMQKREGETPTKCNCTSTC